MLRLYRKKIRHQLFTVGVETLTNAELLTLLIQQQSPSWVSQGHRLSELFNRDFQHLAKRFGISMATYCQLQACLELQRRYLAEPIFRQGRLQRAQDAKALAVAHLRHYDHEIFAALFLDSQHRLIQFEKLFSGSLRETHIHPREVVKRALYHNAAGLIVAHNHPSGNPTPSGADQTATQQLGKALALIDVQLLDHIIVGGHEVYSLAERGLI